MKHWRQEYCIWCDCWWPQDLPAEEPCVNCGSMAGTMDLAELAMNRVRKRINSRAKSAHDEIAALASGARQALDVLTGSYLVNTGFDIFRRVPWVPPITRDAWKTAHYK